MDCFFVFDRTEAGIGFHAEYCTERAVHTVSGVTGDLAALMRATGCESEEGVLRHLTAKFSSNNEFFDFLQKNDISFEVTERTYADTSSDV